jgi:GDP-mannose 6-dehydrogenase
MFDAQIALHDIEASEAGPAEFRPRIISDKVAISVVGLGYVGAVSCACLSAFGHKVIGVDLDARKVDLIGRGASPIHEVGLGELLSDGVAVGRLFTTDDLRRAVTDTQMTIVAVGTPTAQGGGCDFTYIETAARTIGEALAAKDGFHAVVLRCSVPPGTTRTVMGRIIEEASGKLAGIDFGLAFVPEFLREGVAVEDFHNPPKTVIGATDDRTAAMVARVFDEVDAAPIRTDLETAEMVKYVDNVWHAMKVCFANEVGRLSKSMGVDGRRVMDVFCQDQKLNLSPCYLKPGFAYGGSCLPKEVRAVSHLADTHDVELPLIASLGRSNEVQVAEALRLIRQTGARRVGILGLAFKAGTDDLRESPILDVMAELQDDGVKLLAHDAAVTPSTPIAQQLAYVRNGAPGLARLARRLPGLLCDEAADVVAAADVVIVTHNLPEYRALLATSRVPVVDVVQLFDTPPAGRSYAGIGW